jgi:hypothetical protein
MADALAQRTRTCLRPNPLTGCMQCLTSIGFGMRRWSYRICRLRKDG